MADEFDRNICGSDEGNLVNHKMHAEYMKDADPMKDNLRRWEKGRLNRATGEMIPLTAKGLSILDKNLNPSPAYLNNFKNIEWDKPKKDGKRSGYAVRTNKIRYTV